MSPFRDQGPRGETGDTGATGGVGQTGATGARGVPGASGQPGNQGEVGERGHDGHDGVDSANYTPEQIGHVVKQLRRLVLTFALAAFAILAYLLISAHNAQTQNMSVQRAIVHSNRVGCNIGANIYVHYVNQSRAQILGDLAVAADPGQPSTTRVARRLQAIVEQRNVKFFDSIIDSGHARQFDSPIDRKAVAANGVSCNTIYADTTAK